MTVLLVHGTWGRPSAWHREGAPLVGALKAQGFDVIDFLWSGILAGTPNLKYDLPGDPYSADLGADDGQLLPWLDAGEKLGLATMTDDGSKFLVPHIICHSHGLQVVSFAAAIGIKFKTVISLSGPVRRDMLRARRAARPNIQRWVQVADPNDDHVIRAGEEFDGSGSGFVYDLPEADENIHVPGAGHSSMTIDVPRWNALDLWARLR